MKFKDFQAPVLFSSTFKVLNLGEKNSSTFKDAWEPCSTLQGTSLQWNYIANVKNAVTVLQQNIQNSSRRHEN